MSKNYDPTVNSAWGRRQEEEMRDMYNRANPPKVSASASEKTRQQLLEALASTLRDSVSEGTISIPCDYTQSPHYGKVKQWLVTEAGDSFADLHGNEEALAQLKQAISAPVENAELFAAYGMTPPKGAVLFGPPGNGKTMFARAVAGMQAKLYKRKVCFLVINAANIQTGYVNGAEENLEAVYGFADDYFADTGRQLLIFFDEADAAFPPRSGKSYRYEAATVNAILAHLDGAKKTTAFTIFATNAVDGLDEALLRDGRIDYKVEVKRPTQEAAEKIRAAAICKLPKIAASTGDLLFAGMESLYDPAWVLEDAMGLSIRGGEIAHKIPKAFLLSHIVSGAMIVSIPERAKRHAFARDLAANTVTGVQVGDMLAAVQEVFNENKNLPHETAKNEFAKRFEAQLDAMPDKKESKH
jgi:proteasome-associated ATPase